MSIIYEIEKESLHWYEIKRGLYFYMFSYLNRKRFILFLIVISLILLNIEFFFIDSITDVKIRMYEDILVAGIKEPKALRNIEV